MSKLKIGELKKVIKEQSKNGNWNYSPYMYGLANGLICALAVLTGEEPKYKTAPKKWLCEVKPSQRN